MRLIRALGKVAIGIVVIGTTYVLTGSYVSRRIAEANRPEIELKINSFLEKCCTTLELSSQVFTAEALQPTQFSDAATKLLELGSVKTRSPLEYRGWASSAIFSFAEPFLFFRVRGTVNAGPFEMSARLKKVKDDYLIDSMLWSSPAFLSGSHFLDCSTLLWAPGIYTGSCDGRLD